MFEHGQVEQTGERIILKRQAFEIAHNVHVRITDAVDADHVVAVHGRAAAQVGH